MTLTRGTQPRVRLNRPADILATIPFLVGYHPNDSIVILGMRDNRVIFTARDDLPAAGGPPSTQRIDYLVGVLLRQRCRHLMLVGYGSDERVTPTMVALLGAYQDADLKVLDALRADGERYWSYVCANTGCCSPQGNPYDPASSEVAAAWTLAGRVARRDRAEYEAQIRPVTGAAREAMRRATAAARDRLLSVVADTDDEEGAQGALLNAGNLAIAQALDRQLRGIAPTQDEAAWLAVLVQSITIRDIAWGLVRGSGTALYHHRALWQEVLHRAEPDLVPGPASLFAFAAWRCGDGGIARLALERALDVDPHYRMAGMLHQAITMGLPPSTMDEFPAPEDTRRLRGRRRRKRSSKARA